MNNIFNFFRLHKTECAIFFLSLGLHLLLFAVMVSMHGSVLNVVRVDDGYFELAQSLLQGNGFSWSTEEPYLPNSLRTPGYIYILAGLMGSIGITGAALFQLFIASFIPVLGMKIAHFISNSRTISIVTGTILAIDPTLAVHSYSFYTDTIFLIFFYPWLLLTLYYSKNKSLKLLCFTAVLLGISILIRPVAQYLPLLVACCILWQFGKDNLKTSVVHIGIYFLIITAVVSPWIIRNMIVFNSPILSTQTSFILYTNLAPAVLSVAEKRDFLEMRDEFLTAEEYRGDAITPSNARYYTKEAFEIIGAHPHATAFVAMRSLFTFFTIDGFYAFLSQLGYEPRDYIPFLIGARLIWVFITLFAVLGALIYVNRNRTLWAIFFIILIAYFAGTSILTGFGTNPRYRLPIDPIFIALAGIGILNLQTWVSQTRCFARFKNLLSKHTPA